MPDHKESNATDTARLVLVLGGARSGKSTFAERLAASSERSVAYIATATAFDDDMRTRIAHHRAQRPSAWHTIEEPLDLPRAVKQAAAVADVLLLDCMTVWLSNWLLMSGDAVPDNDAIDASAQAAIETFLAVWRMYPATKTLIVVTNEVGQGIVPAYELGRLYRDILGRINQRLAGAAERVYLMVAGLGVDIKRLHQEAQL